VTFDACLRPGVAMYRLIVVLGCCGLAGPAAIAAALQSAPAPLRLIAVGTAQEATELRARIAGGASFDALARERSLDPSATQGGWLGRVVAADLRPEFRDAVRNLAPGELSPVTRVSGAYVLLQWVPEAEERWMAASRAGLAALDRGSLAEATRLLESAVSGAESLGPNDPRLAESLDNLAGVYRIAGDLDEAARVYELARGAWAGAADSPDVRLAATLNNLAETHRLLGNHADAAHAYEESRSILEEVLGPGHVNVAYSLNGHGQVLAAEERHAEAEPLYRRAVAILEIAGGESQELAIGLNNLAQTLGAQGKHAEAAPLYRRVLSILDRRGLANQPIAAESLAGLSSAIEADGAYAEAVTLLERALTIRWGRTPDADVGGLLDSLSAVLDLAYFPADLRPEQNFLRFRELAAQTPIREDLFGAMGALLRHLDMKNEAVRVLSDAANAFPDSGRLRSQLGEAHADVGQTRQAIEEFSAALRLASGEAPLLRARLHRRMGDLEAELLLFGDAEESYRAALELAGPGGGARLALANVYLRTSRLEEAADQYTRILSSDPENAAAHTGLSDANLRLERFGEAEAAAGRALEIDPAGITARYHRARALIRMGRIDAGRAELLEYNALQAQAAAEQNQDRLVPVLNKDANDRLVNGEEEEALLLFRRSIESAPETPAFYFNLGMAESRLNRPLDAVETFERMVEIESGDHFMAHRQLAIAYGRLGDLEASSRHRAVYLRKITAELGARVD